ncbi:AsmA family protein [Chitinophaga arvensicola]|uniref:AsmA-like C-terminal region n=1 Tax=Chitinophaga arvensicola TaxID=29529 RepID=A0A1I0S7U0_9BACT|nr:AsmA-like C-terminal region-containing protein [Chitinophaga arvensicola]SEW50534.1 AsmA-like C-terminal region [Chitinophaga arvensicola]
MKKWIRITLLTGGILIALLVLLFLGMTWYIHANKDNFLKQITAQVNDRLSGNLTIEDMEPSLLKSFPNISIGLKKVVLQDSLYQRHHHALLDVSYIYVRVNTLSLLRKHVNISEITLQNGAVYLYTDTTGYSNTYVLQGQSDQKKKSKSSKDANIKKLTLRNINFVIDNQQKFKLFNLDVRQLDGKVSATDSAIQFTMVSDILSKNFAFNTNKGSYLKDKKLELNLSVIFNKRTKILALPQQEIRIDGHPVLIAGQFGFGEKPPPFQLKINANQVLLKDAASWLSPNITTKLNSISLTKPLDAEANLNGHMKYRDTPNVVITWKTTNNVLVTTLGEWTDCNFTGRFNNEVLPGQGHTDENSAVNIFQLSATLAGVPLKADTIRVVNLKQPLLHGHFRSNFPLTNLNGAAEGSPILFKNGNANVNLFYTGPILANDNTPSSLEGIVEVKQGAFSYIPRNLSFHDANATLRFTGQDLLMENVHIQTEKSNLQMDGVVKNLLNLYFTTPEKIELTWNIRSQLVDLNEFKSFLAPRQKAKPTASQQKAKMGRVSRQLDVVLASSNVNMNVQLDKVTYQRFTAQNVKASLELTNSDILLKQIALQHAGGNMQLAGSLHQQGNNNNFTMNATVNNVHIGQLFYAFDNFGLSSLTSNNLKGNVSAKVNLKGNVLDNGSLGKNSLYGTINFNLKNGALINFGPLADIGNFAFRKRHLDSITIDNLSNTFQVQGNKVLIPPMRIASSAINIDVNGVYGIDGGTNINLDIPLRNPAKDSAITDKEEKRKRSRKGIILHLRAVSEKDGKVKIKLGKGDKADAGEEE